MRIEQGEKSEGLNFCANPLRPEYFANLLRLRSFDSDVITEIIGLVTYLPVTSMTAAHNVHE